MFELVPGGERFATVGEAIDLVGRINRAPENHRRSAESRILPQLANKADAAESAQYHVGDDEVGPNTPSTLFRAIEQWKPTLVVDELDAFISGNEELRGILNAGHTRGLAYVLRNVRVGGGYEPRRFSVWGPKALAAIGRLPGTLDDRSITIKMRRRKKNEKIDRVRLDRLRVELRPLRERCLRWATDNAPALRALDPRVPDGLGDRDADNWRPLLAIADLAAGDFPIQARDAASKLSKRAEKEAAGVMLLEDLFALFRKRGEKIPSTIVCRELAALEHRPWREWKQNRPISQIGVAQLLDPFEIGPRQLGGPRNLRGYDRADFLDTFDRYVSVDTIPTDAGLAKPLPRYKTRGRGAIPETETATVMRVIAVPEPPKPLSDKVSSTPAGRNDGANQESLLGKLCTGSCLASE
jgi:Protein of unknown function (DUF3631)